MWETYYMLCFAILLIHRQVWFLLNVHCFTKVRRIMFCMSYCTAIRILFIVCHTVVCTVLALFEMKTSCCSDRVPFVLTSDMAYVINGGDKSSCKFQEFVDLCCCALNMLRQHGNLFLNLFSLVSLLSKLIA